MIVLTATNNDEVDYNLEVVLKTKGYGVENGHTVNTILSKNAIQEIGRYHPEANLNEYSFGHESRITSIATSSNSGSANSKKSDNQQALHVESDGISESNSTTGEGKENINNSDLKSSKAIVVYSKKGCGRCSMAVDYLADKGIEYNELDITSNKSNKKEMSDLMFAGGFEGGSFSTPVIVINGEAHYNIKNLRGFLRGIK